MSKLNADRSREAREAAEKIIACGHPDPEKCPPLRSPSCQFALAYFEKWEPNFEATWRDAPKHPAEAAVGSNEIPAAVKADLEKIRGRLPLPETK